MDIATWLYGLGLEQYEKAFRDNAIDAAILPELTAEDAAGFARDDTSAVKLDKLRRLFGEGRFGQLRRRVAYQAAQRGPGQPGQQGPMVLRSTPLPPSPNAPKFFVG